MPKSAKRKSKPKQKVKVNSHKSTTFNSKPYFIHYFFCLLIILLLILTGLNINKYLNTQKVLGTSVDVSPLQDEKTYWQKIVADNPTYTDGYLELAKINYELGNKIEAINSLNKAIVLDPNSDKIREVQKILGL